MIKIRHSNGCVHEHDILKLKNYKKFDVDVNVLGNTETRKMFTVQLVDKKTGDYNNWYVDAITGTIYDIKSGRCSTHEVFIEKVYK